jgi:hypothetical protein
VAVGFGAVNPAAATGCAVPPAPVGNFFRFNNIWLWIIILAVFVLPSLGAGGCGGIGGLFGGLGWIWILLLVVFLVPKILPGFRLGGFAI